MSLKALKDKLFDIYFLCKRVFLVLIIFTCFYNLKGCVSAASSDTSYFQGKIVIKADGTNISGNNPSCVVTNSSDTCDFRVGYYSATSGGTLLWQEDFSNIELGDHDGVFSLALGTGTNNSGSESSYKDVFKNNSDVYMQLSFDKDGNGDFDSPEIFNTSSGDRMQIRGVPYAIRAEYLDSTNNQFIKNQQTQQSSTNFNIDGNGTIAGIFNVGTSNIFYANGTTNKVGIGTTNPLGFFSIGESSQFQIDSSGKITAATGITSSGSIKFSNLLSGMLKTDNTGLISIATGGTDYEYPLSFSGPLSRNGNLISINQSGLNTDGYLSSADWNKFNNSANLTSVTKEPTGFPNRTDTSLSFNNSNRNFTITGTNFDIYIRGQKLTKNTESIQIGSNSGIYFIYYNSSGDLISSNTAWTFADAVQVATVYWNGSIGVIGDERHGMIMDPMTHEYLHNTVGTRYQDGLTGTFNNTSFSITSGSIYDEDIKHDIAIQTTARVLHKASGGTTFTYTSPQSAYYQTSGGGVIQWDNNGTLTDVINNSYVAYWVFATNDITTPIYSLVGQRTDVKIADARANNTYESLSLANLPFSEMKLLYRVILRNVNGTPTYTETQDMRTVSNLPAGTYIATSHSSLTSLLSDDHTQYALLAGRSGGQTFTGSIDTNTGLTIKATSGNGTTGADIIFQTGNNGSTEAMRIVNSGKVGIGVTAPKGVLDIYNSYAGNPATSGSTDNNIGLRVGSGTIGIDFGIYTNGTSWIQNRNISDLSSNYNLVLQPNGGYVGIGVAVPNQELEVGGRIRMDTWTADGTTAVYKNANGDIGIQSSDERLKKNIVNLQNSLDIINSIRTVKFNWLSDTDNSPKTIGVIAQDLLPILPEAVFNFTDPNDGNTYYGVHYEKLGVLALDGIKGLSSEMTSLRTQISSIDQLYSGSLWTINNDGALYSTRDVILGNVLATKATINEIHTDVINVMDINVTRLLTTNKIVTSLIEARNDENIAIKLTEKIGNTSFEILNSDGSRVFGVNSLGDVYIKGKLNLNEEGNSRTVGTDNVPAGQVMMQISSEAVTSKSKVFLSVTDNSDIFPILKVSKVDSGFFEVILDKIRSIDTVFDWFVIN